MAETGEDTGLRATPPARIPPAVPAAIVLCLLLCAALAGCSHPADPPPPPDTPAFYTQVVQPILRENCYRCHASLNHKGGLRLDSPAAIRAGGKDGPDLVPFHPESSLLITLIRHQDTAIPDRNMPPKGKLTDAEIADITSWVQAGARMPEAPAQ